MKTYTHYIELINDYLNNLLSEDAHKNFELKLENDSELRSLYDEHLVLLGGLTRVQIKAEISKAKRCYYTEKWLKIFGIVFLILGLVWMFSTKIFKTLEVKSNSSDEYFHTVISDSIADKKTAKDTIETNLLNNDSTNTTQPKEGHETDMPILHSETTTEFKKKAQQVLINTQNDTVITTKEGTILKITKASFIYPITAKKVTGIVELEITEYYKLSDMLLMNLSTTSNNKLLETGGMIHVKATQGNTELELGKSSTIEISFPTKIKKPGMQLFSGNWNEETINWTLQDNNPEPVDTLEINIEVPFNIVQQVPTFPGCENDDDAIRQKCTVAAISKFITKNFNTDIAYNLGLTGTQRVLSVFKIDQNGRVTSIQSRAAHPRLSDEATRVINLLPQMIPGMQNGKTVIVPYSIPINFQVDFNNIQERFGRIQNNSLIKTEDSIFSNNQVSKSLEMDTIYNDRRGMVEFIREVMHDKQFKVDSLFLLKWNAYKKENLIREVGQLNNRRFILRKPLFEIENTRFKILADDSITRGGHIIRTPWDASKIPTVTRFMNIIPKRKFYAGNEALIAEEFESRLLDSTESYISSRDVSYYILNTSKLGWINCDRFSNSRTKRIKYKLKVKNADGANINLVFKSINAILPSSNNNGVYDFQTVGLDEDVVLVAIKRKNGKLYFDTVETKTTKKPKINFEFKEVSVEELRREIEKLDALFD